MIRAFLVLMCTVVGAVPAGATWQELPAGPWLQGLNLAAHNGKIYSVGAGSTQ